MDKFEVLRKTIDNLNDGGWVRLHIADGLILAALPDSVSEPQPDMVLAFADSKTMLQYFSALDLTVFDWFQDHSYPCAIRLGGILGVPEQLLDNDLAMPVTLFKEGIVYDLIKLLKRPLLLHATSLESWFKMYNLKKTGF